jgi:hypothetical protein
MKHKKIAAAAAAGKQENGQPAKIVFGMYQDLAAWTKTLVILIAHIHPHLSTLVPKRGKDQRSHHPHLLYTKNHLNP